MTPETRYLGAPGEVRDVSHGRCQSAANLRAPGERLPRRHAV